MGKPRIQDLLRIGWAYRCDAICTLNGTFHQIDAVIVFQNADIRLWNGRHFKGAKVENPRNFEWN